MRILKTITICDLRFTILKSKVFLLFTIYCLLLAVPAFSNNNIIRTEVMGSIPASVEMTKPDDLAIEDAFRRAVVKATEAIIPRKDLDIFALLLDDKIYGNPSRYILNYRILSKEIMEDDVSATEGGVPIYNVSIEAEIAVDMLTKDLVSAGIIHEGEVRKVALAILGLRDYKGFELFKSNLSKTAGVKEIRYDLFATGRIELSVKTTGDAQGLRQEIMAMDIKDWKMDVSVMPGMFFADRIEVKFSPMKGQANK